MDKNFLIQLTTELYRLTLLFPKKEPLRYKMRELADEILAKCLRLNLKQNSVLEDLEVLDSFFEVAKAQNWVSPAEALKLQQEYSKLKGEVKSQFNFNRSLAPATQVGSVTKQDLVALSPRSGGDCGENSQTVPFGERVNGRQQKILEILKEREKAQVWEIKKFFPEVAKRTLRRDFEFLLQEGAVERIGERNDTFYKLKSIET